MDLATGRCSLQPRVRERLLPESFQRERTVASVTPDLQVQLHSLVSVEQRLCGFGSFDLDRPACQLSCTLIKLQNPSFASFKTSQLQNSGPLRIIVTLQKTEHHGSLAGTARSRLRCHASVLRYVSLCRRPIPKEDIGRRSSPTKPMKPLGQVVD